LVSEASGEIQVVRGFFERLTCGNLDAAFAHTARDFVTDVRNSHAPWSGIYRGEAENRAAYGQIAEAWDNLHWEPGSIEPAPGRRIVCEARLRGRGRGSGIEVDARGGWLLTLRDGLLHEAVVFQTLDESWRAARARAFAEARLYFVCEARPHGDDPDELLDAALRGGAEIVQLRDKGLGEEELVAAARPFRRAATAQRALFILNDRPDLVAAAGADGVHVGQGDRPVAAARDEAGPASVVGLSTHTAAEVNGALATSGDARPDQLSVGPVWETPTKEGRSATGLGLVEQAAAADGDIPWFAIGGIDGSNVERVIAAGARRVVVVRAIRDAPDPAAAARELRAALDAAQRG
jgi:thiamine-phosphate pyrophosphorylase